MNLVIGLITPHLGEVLFIVGPIAGVSLERRVREILPFLIVEIAVLLLVSYVPIISLWIPSILGYLK
jgi:TRAP-type C4-dicarboxylate transport system permease large subunit